MNEIPARLCRRYDFILKSFVKFPNTYFACILYLLFGISLRKVWSLTNAAEDSQRSSKFPVNDLAVLDEIAQRDTAGTYFEFNIYVD